MHKFSQTDGTGFAVEKLSEALKEKLERYRETEPRGKSPELQEGVDDVSSKQDQLIQLYAPSIEIPRRNLVRRKGVTIFGRALQDSESERICLQYLYVFPFRIGIQSHIFNLIGPLLMILWAALVFQLFTIGALPFLISQLPIIVVSVTLAPILILGLEPHIKDWFRHSKGTRLNIRPNSWLVLYYLLTLTLLIGWSFWSSQIVTIIFIGVVLVVLSYLYSNLRTRTFQRKHAIEYTIIMKWLKKIEDEWILENAFWSYYEKSAIYINRLLLKLSPFRIRNRTISKTRPLDEDKRVRFHIDNTWSSLQLDHRGKQKLNQILNGLLFFLVIPLSFLTVPLNLAAFIAGSYILVWFVVIIVEWPTQLKVETEDAKIPYLSPVVLRTFWEMSPEARLSVKWKLQFPFLKENLYFTTMDDSAVRVVIDSFHIKDEDDARVLIYGHATPVETASLKTEDFLSDGVNLHYFRKKYELSHKQLASFLNKKNVDKILEGDIFESSNVQSLLEYVDTHFELEPLDKEVHLPNLDLSFSKVTDRIKKEFQDWHFLVREYSGKLTPPSFYDDPKQLESSFKSRIPKGMKIVYQRKNLDQGSETD